MTRSQSLVPVVVDQHAGDLRVGRSPRDVMARPHPGGVARYDCRYVTPHPLVVFNSLEEGGVDGNHVEVVHGLVCV